MKNKTKKKIGVACGILLILLVQAIGITYAKYIASEKGSGYAQIAQWSFEIQKDTAETKTINLADTVEANSDINGKLAPGSSGVINIVLDASNSEVGVDYTVEFTNEQNKPDNLTFIANGITYNSISEIVRNGTIDKDSTNKTSTITVLWRWPYETGKTDDEKMANNIKDTEYANKNTEYTFDIIATGAQSN